MEENQISFTNIREEDKSRSVSPLSPSPRLERNLGFFHQLSKRFAKRSHDDLAYNGEDDLHSSSTDSCSSSTGQIRRIKDPHNSNLELSCASSDTGSSADESDKSSISRHFHRNSTSSIRRVLENFSISTRSLSCSSTSSKESKTKKINRKTPQKILRQPVSYTYLKGMSGLPTQRVPKSAVCCHYNHP